MDVILLEDMKGVGSKGQTVHVKPGFARNYLLPHRLAISTGTKAAGLFQELERQREAQEQKLLVKARAEADRLQAVELNLPAAANEEDTLFGSITNADIADALAKAGFQVDKHRIEMEDHIKQLGKYDVPIRIYGGVTATVKIWVVRP